MSIVTFDTLKFARRLKDAGVPEQQAETAVMAIKEAFSEAFDTQVATKSDIQSVQAEISKLEAKIILTQWMVGLVIAVQVLPLLKGLL